MLKVAIWPSFLNKALFEIKADKGGWTLLLTKESYADLQDQGCIWSQPIAADAAEQLIALAQSIIQDPGQGRHVIADGVAVTLRLQVEQAEIKHRFMSPLPASNEAVFIEQLLALAQASIPEVECQNYLELLEPYFFERSPCQEFTDGGYRLKIIGHLSSQYEEELTTKFHRLHEHKHPILDMTNFMGAGTALAPCFLSLLEMPGLSVRVNVRAHRFLQEIGFDHPRLVIAQA